MIAGIAGPTSSGVKLTTTAPAAAVVAIAAVGYMSVGGKPETDTFCRRMTDQYVIVAETRVMRAVNHQRATLTISHLSHRAPHISATS